MWLQEQDVKNMDDTGFLRFKSKTFSAQLEFFDNRMLPPLSAVHIRLSSATPFFTGQTLFKYLQLEVDREKEGKERKQADQIWAEFFFKLSKNNVIKKKKYLTPHVTPERRYFDNRYLTVDNTTGLDSGPFHSHTDRFHQANCPLLAVPTFSIGNHG